MIPVEPGDLILRHQRGLDQPGVDRREGERLERVHRLLGARQLDFGNQQASPFIYVLALYFPHILLFIVTIVSGYIGYRLIVGGAILIMLFSGRISGL